jgi:hypothetical protein
MECPYRDGYGLYNERWYGGRNWEVDVGWCEKVWGMDVGRVHSTSCVKASRGVASGSLEESP